MVQHTKRPERRCPTCRRGWLIPSPKVMVATILYCNRKQCGAKFFDNQGTLIKRG